MEYTIAKNWKTSEVFIITSGNNYINPLKNCFFLLTKSCNFYIKITVLFEKTNILDNFQCTFQNNRITFLSHLMQILEKWILLSKNRKISDIFQILTFHI